MSIPVQRYPPPEPSPLFVATTAAEIEQILATGESIERLEWKIVSIEDSRTSILTDSLAWACFRGLKEVVECLIAHGCSLDGTPGKGISPVQMAALAGNADIVSLLARAGANIDNRGNGWSWTALTIASRLGHVDVVDLLLSLGADMETKDWKGMTALMWASGMGRIDVVDRLLAAGCDIHALDRDGKSALMHSVLEGDVPIIDRLVVHGADFQAHFPGQKTLLMAACQNGNLEAASRLLSLGCDINAQDLDGWTALIWACSTKRPNIVEFLLDNGADPLIRTKMGSQANIFTQDFRIKRMLEGEISSQKKIIV